MAKKARVRALLQAQAEQAAQVINCACVIHSTGYDWRYVERLLNMLKRNLSKTVVLHVYTEAERAVPEPFVKHALTDWGISGARKSWWYKIQLFNPEHFRGPLLYLDLDTVIVGNIDWITELSSDHFWAIKDFRYLQFATCQGFNSSVMWWNTAKHEQVYREFLSRTAKKVMARYPGDQDYISEVIGTQWGRHFDSGLICSWRWQCLDGGYDFARRAWRQPGTGTQVADARILVFHGKPKPADTQDPVIVANWR